MSTTAILAVRRDGRWHGVPVAANGAPPQTGAAILDEVKKLGGRLDVVAARLVDGQPAGWRCLYSGWPDDDGQTRALGPQSDLKPYEWIYLLDPAAHALQIVRLSPRRVSTTVRFGEGGAPEVLPRWYRPARLDDLPLRPATWARRIGWRWLEAWCKGRDHEPRVALRIVQAVLTKPFEAHPARRFWVACDDDASSALKLAVGRSTVVVPDRPRIATAAAFAQPGAGRRFCRLDYRVLADWSAAGEAHGWAPDDGPNLAIHLAKHAACHALGNTHVHVYPGDREELLETFVFRRVVRVVRNEAQEIDIRRVARYDQGVEEGDEVGIPVPDGGARFSVALLRLYADTHEASDL